MTSEDRFRSVIVTLWYRLTSLAIVGLWFSVTLNLASGKILGWSFYMTPSEIAFEVAVRLIFTALVGMLVGTILSAVLLPFVWFFQSSRNRILRWLTKAGVMMVLFLSCRGALTALIKWSYQISDHRGIIDTAIWGAFYVAFVLAGSLPASRSSLLTSLDGILDDRFMRRLSQATIACAAALVIVEIALARAETRIEAYSVPQHPKSNAVLITFDALSAEDMSLYGYKLPTTPNIDAFAHTATVFKNFYSGSSFTTPCVATIMTGLYPSQTHVHHLHGELTEPDKTLPHVLRTAGYTTAAFFSNPSAHYLAESVGSEYDFLPEPIFLRGVFQHLWNATTLIHQRSRFGNRADEHADLILAWTRLMGLPTNSHEGLSATETFENARQLVNQLPDGFFLWIHVMTPHAPYLPGHEERGRFLPAHVQQFFEGKDEPKWNPHYDGTQQSEVDKYRLRYDEFILTADRTFGSFISDLASRGKLENTTVILSADHGESFEGGMYQHGGPYLTRPVIHIPLIIKTPGQKKGGEVVVTTDETALAPTILEALGVRKPDWMRGESLMPLLNRTEAGPAGGLAFTQYFEKNSIYKPLQHGSVGVIDGQYQYVFDLETRKGKLRPLQQAHIWNLDRSPENPRKVEELRAAIYSRFPELVEGGK
jgi:arylsulfatase A-like enzyme